MKHFRTVSRNAPARANEFQDAICAIAGVVAAVLGALGGASPIVVLIDDKCAFPEPEGNDGGA